MSATDKELDHRALRRREHIATAAYYNAERRGFTPGGELDDWLLAERDADSPQSQLRDNGSAGAGLSQSVSRSSSPEQTMPLLQGEHPSREEAVAPDDLRLWADRLGIDAETLRTAISKVGPRAEDVKGYLSKQTQRKDKPEDRRTRR